MTSYFRYLPNVITIARMLALVPLVWLMWQKEYKWALYVAFLAGLSDGVDGFLAKRYGWQGWLGGILDPLADKLMMLCCYTVFALQGLVPWWLFILVVGRDVVIVCGASYYHFMIGKLKEATPTFISKANTALQILLVLMVLMVAAGWLNWGQWLPWLFYLVAIFTVLSGIHYVWLGLQMAKAERQSMTQKNLDQQHAEEQKEL